MSLTKVCEGFEKQLQDEINKKFPIRYVIDTYNHLQMTYDAIKDKVDIKERMLKFETMVDNYKKQ